MTLLLFSAWLAGALTLGSTWMFFEKKNIPVAAAVGVAALLTSLYSLTPTEASLQDNIRKQVVSECVIPENAMLRKTTGTTGYTVVIHDGEVVGYKCELP